MEEVAKCKKMVATYKDDKIILGGPHVCEFVVERNEKFYVKIEQCGTRKIIVKSEHDISVSDLNTIFSRIERLLQLFDVPLHLFQNLNF